MEYELFDTSEPVLVTGAAGFIGRSVVACLLEKGFSRIRCFCRTAHGRNRLLRIAGPHSARVEALVGNLLRREDCRKAVEGIGIVIHLAAGTGLKSVSDAYLNSVVTTRNLLDAVVEYKCVKRFVNLSTFSVYSNQSIPRRGVFDETCSIENDPRSRSEAYCYAKAKQDEIVRQYAQRYSLPVVTLRPGVVFGPGKKAISGRVGIDLFGIFLHFGGANRLPLTYVENCAEAIVRGAIVKGVEGEVFNVVDDDLPTCRDFLGQFKKRVGNFRSVYIPHLFSYLFCRIWEMYSEWSGNQVPPVYTRREWRAYWKFSGQYSNEKLKTGLGWSSKIPMTEGLQRFFAACRGE